MSVFIKITGHENIVGDFFVIYIFSRRLTWICKFPWSTKKQKKFTYDMVSYKHFVKHAELFCYKIH